MYSYTYICISCVIAMYVFICEHRTPPLHAAAAIVCICSSQPNPYLDPNPNPRAAKASSRNNKSWASGITPLARREAAGVGAAAAAAADLPLRRRRPNHFHRRHPRHRQSERLLGQPRARLPRAPWHPPCPRPGEPVVLPVAVEEGEGGHGHRRRGVGCPGAGRGRRGGSLRSGTAR